MTNRPILAARARIPGWSPREPEKIYGATSDVLKFGLLPRPNIVSYLNFGVFVYTCLVFTECLITTTTTNHDLVSYRLYF